MAGKRLALIIATSQYNDPDIGKLVSPAQDAKALTGILKDIEIGAFEQVKELLNRPSFEINEEIEDFFNERSKNDLLLLYFSCHGIKDDEGHLYFATINTRREKLYSTAVSADFVNNIMKRSRSKRQVLLLDCCYSGAFAKGMVAKAGDKEIHTKEQFDGYGKIILTASDAMQYSFEGNDFKKVGADEAIAPGSVFTQAILEGLKSGNADLDKDGHISPDELYDYTFDFVRRVTPIQRPGKYALGIEGTIVIANALITKVGKESESDQEEETLKLLLNGRIQEFNKKRRDTPLSYQKVDLSGKVLPKADLHDIDFTGAKLVNTNLRKANLSGAIFKDADLSGVDLKNTDLDGAHLDGANLSGANLTGADLKDADLKGNVNFVGANLTGADFKYTDLSEGNINFEGARLDNADFTRAKIDTKLVNFKGAIIDNDVVGLTNDFFFVGDNKYVKDIKTFSEIIEKQIKSLNVGPEQIKLIEESVKGLTNEVQDINNDEEKLTDIRKQDVKTKLIIVLEKVIDTLPKTNEQTLDLFDSLNSFKKLIGEEFQQIIQDIIVQKEKENIEKSMQYYTEEGGKLQTLGKYKEAIECYNNALEIMPNDFEIICYKGLAFFNLTNYDEAIKYFDQCLNLNPKYANALKYKELAVDKLKKYNADTWNERGEVLIKQNKFEEAIDYFSKSLEANSENAQVWYKKGLAFSHLSRYEEAINCFDKVLAIEPNNVYSLTGKGLAVDGLGKHIEAIKYYDRALAVEPNSTITLINKGNAFSNLGRNQEAIQYYDRALELDPNFADAWYKKGEALYYEYSYTDAETCFDRVLKLDPNNKLAQVRKKDIALRTHKATLTAVTTPDNTSMEGSTILWSMLKNKKVKSNDGKDVGEIKEISQNFFRLEKGTVKKDKFWIPKYVADAYDGNTLWLLIGENEVIKKYHHGSEGKQIEMFKRALGGQQADYRPDSEENIRVVKNYGAIIMGTDDKQNKRVFIGYAYKDREAALRLYKELKDAGLEPWLDVEFLLPGEDWRKAITKAIKDSQYFIPILSSNSVEKRGYVQKELKEELDILGEISYSKIYVIPVRLDDCKVSHSRVNMLHIVDLFPDWKRGIEEILQSIKPFIKYS